MTKRKCLSLIKDQGTGFQKHSLWPIQHKEKQKQNQPNVQKTANDKTSQQNQKKNTNQGTKKKSVQNQSNRMPIVKKKKIVILNKWQEFLVLKKKKN